MSSATKGRAFHYPPVSPTCFGRRVSAACHGGTVHTAATMEEDRRTWVVVVSRSGGRVRPAVLETPGSCHQVSIASKEDGALLAAWNEVDDDGWHIRVAELPAEHEAFGPVTTVFSQEALCLGPQVVCVGKDAWLVWAAMVDGQSRIHVAGLRNGEWEPAHKVSPAGLDAFRPTLAAGKGMVIAAWDQYRDANYEIGLARWDDGSWEPVPHLAQPGERWFCPRASAGSEDRAYLTWVVMRTVTDDRGIIDHFPFAMVGRLDEAGVRYLKDAGNPSDPRIVADLREGLLAAECYKGYHGLRRNPFLTLSGEGAPWCVWESRIEAERSHLAGHLVGRQLLADDAWTEPTFLHNGRFGYAVPPAFGAEGLGLSFFTVSNAGLEMLDGEIVPVPGGTPLPAGSSQWEHWRAAGPTVQPKPRRSVTHQDRTYKLFWADTHCHSNFSPDAEGEVDEIIHFARDTAGLDAVCVIDNDYYPHKSLTEAEWRIHQALSEHFTEPGRFVTFCGYEFTFHREDLEPDFNHRTVIYGRPGGRLLRRIDPETRSERSLLASIPESGALVYPHHCSYDLVDPRHERNVEVCSSWRVCIEESDFTIQALRKGHKLGFIGSSDSHRAVPGLGGAVTGVYAEELTPESLMEAYRNRRLIATSGCFVHIDFRVSGAFIGETLEGVDVPRIEAGVEAPRDIESVRVVRDGVTIHEISPGATTCELKFEDRTAESGPHFYFLRVKLVGDPSLNFEGDPARGFLGPFTVESRYPHNLARARGAFAWTSPIWVVVR